MMKLTASYQVKHTKHLSELKTSRLLLLLLWVVVILYLSFAKPQSLPSISVGGSFSDKWAHFVMYFVLTTVVCFAIPRNLRTLRNSFIAAVFATVFGMIIEIMQYALTDYRSGDVDDALANMAGALLGLFVFLPRRKR
jgi:VanZ family protein